MNIMLLSRPIFRLPLEANCKEGTRKMLSDAMGEIFERWVKNKSCAILLVLLAVYGVMRRRCNYRIVCEKRRKKRMPVAMCER